MTFLFRVMSLTLHLLVPVGCVIATGIDLAAFEPGHVERRPSSISEWVQQDRETARELERVQLQTDLIERFPAAVLIGGIMLLLVNENLLNRPGLRLFGLGWFGRALVALGAIALGIAGSVAALT